MRRSVISTEIDFLIELDFGGYLCLILVAWVNFEILFLMAEGEAVFYLFLIFLVDDEGEVLLRYFMSKYDRLIVLDRNVKLHIVAIDFNEE